MRTVLVGANVIQSHLFFSATSLCLKENGFSVTTFRTRMIFSSWQRWIRDDVRNDVRQFTKILENKLLLHVNNFIISLNFVHNFVHVDAVRVSFGFVVAVTACIEQKFVLLIFLRVQHVIAFLKII